MNNSILNNYLSNFYLSSPDNVKFIGYGYKIKNNIQTNIKSIVFGVEQKLPLNEILPDQLIPNNLTIDNTNYITDVIEIKGSFNKSSYCYTCDINNTSDDHRTRTLPIKGGISLGIENQNKAGTLGLIVKDNQTNTLVGLTCGHIVVSNTTINSSRENEISQASSTQNINIVQPAYIDDSDNHYIGAVKRYIPIDPNSINIVDAAIISLDFNTISQSDSIKQVGLNNTQSLPFATTQEIDSLLDEPRPMLVKSGRTSGFVNCEMATQYLFGSLDIVDIDNSTFSDCIIFSYLQEQNGDWASNVVCPGDSGQVIIANFNGIYKVVGLVFAGGATFEYFGNPYNLGIACRIDKVSQLLDISNWDGSAPIKYSNKNNWIFLNKNGLLSNVSITENNKKYWQAGTILADNQLKSLYVSYMNCEEINIESYTILSKTSNSIVLQIASNTLCNNNVYFQVAFYDIDNNTIQNFTTIQKINSLIDNVEISLLPNTYRIEIRLVTSVL